MNSSIQIYKITGKELSDYLQVIAKLRITVFREYPYLYQGNLDYEIEYLKPYLKSKEAVFFVVKDKDKIAGASTCIPLWQEDPVFQKPFLEHGREVHKVMYFGESILLPPYRGQGIGKEFFYLREQYANEFPNVQYCTFCAVERPDDHPLKPAGYRELDNFWIHQGYQKHPELITQLSWQDIKQSEETSKEMIFWLKKIK